jgi:polyhydroxybutyrate depolymerase
VHPEAIGHFWNFVAPDDLDYLEEIVALLIGQGCVDANSVYAVGFSQGGDFAALAACRRPGLLAGVASVAVVNSYAPCQDWQATPLIALAGEADPIYLLETGLREDVPISGDPADRPGPLTDEVGAWAALNGCSDGAARTEQLASAEMTDFECPAGADVRYLVHDGGHVWPGGGDRPASDGPAASGLDASEMIFQFFEADDS